MFADVRAARGETVGLRLEPAGCHLFPVESPAEFPVDAEQAQGGG